MAVRSSVCCGDMSKDGDDLSMPGESAAIDFAEA